MTRAVAHSTPWVVPSANDAANSRAQPMKLVGASLMIACLTSGSWVVTTHRPRWMARTTV
jgi:hypothetical protein